VRREQVRQPVAKTRGMLVIMRVFMIMIVIVFVGVGFVVLHNLLIVLFISKIGEGTPCRT
jgi:hypothetical protein